MTLRIQNIKNTDDPLFDKFIELPKKIYRGNSNYVMPLKKVIKSKLSLKNNSFFEYGDISHYLFIDSSNNIHARVSLIINPEHNRVQNDKTCFFGMFESFNESETVKTLFNALESDAVEKGYNKLVGPVNLSTNDESGVLIEGFEKPHTFMCSYSNSYYNNLLKSCGFNKAIDTFSYMATHGHPFPDKYYRIVKRIEADDRITLKRFEKKNASSDVLKIVNIYNNSFKDNWGFVPYTKNEALQLAENLIPFVDEDLIWIAYFEDKPIGAILGFPDINELFAGLNGKIGIKGALRFLRADKKIKSMRIAMLGVEKEYRRLGIETALIHKVHQRVHTRPYQRSEFSVVLENNLRMRNLLERFGFIQTHRFRIYEKEIG